MLFPEGRFPGNDKPDITDGLVHALKAWFNGDTAAASAHCKKHMDAYRARPSKKITYRRNYYTLHQALWGILQQDPQTFAKGIQAQLAIWHHDAHYGEDKGTVSGHYAEFAVAMTNLGIHAGLPQPVVDPFIPQGLVWTPADDRVTG